MGNLCFRAGTSNVLMFPYIIIAMVLVVERCFNICHVALNKIYTLAIPIFPLTAFVLFWPRNSFVAQACYLLIVLRSFSNLDFTSFEK